MGGPGVILLSHRWAYVAAYAGGHAEAREVRVCPLSEPLAILPREAGEVEASAAFLAGLVRRAFPGTATWRIVIPSSWCLCQAVEVTTRTLTDRSAVFALEPYVPVEAERLTGVATKLDEGHALVACVFTDAMRRGKARVTTATLRRAAPSGTRAA